MMRSSESVHVNLSVYFQPSQLLCETYGFHPHIMSDDWGSG